jgi:hypothetical protein
MPPLTRWYVRSAMVCFIFGLLLGAVQLAPGAPAWIAATGPVATHLLVVGWVTQMIFAVAYWMFPKDSAAAPRGSDVLAVATFLLLNAGLLGRLVAEPARAVSPGPGLGAALALAALAQWLAGIGFVVNTWRRVKER